MQKEGSARACERKGKGAGGQWGRPPTNLFKHVKHVQEPKHANDTQQPKRADNCAALLRAVEQHVDVKRQPTGQIDHVFEFPGPAQGLFYPPVFLGRLLGVVQTSHGVVLREDPCRLGRHRPTRDEFQAVLDAE